MSRTTSAPLPDLLQLLAYGPVVLDSALSMEEFSALSRQFPELRMEREANGKITIMTPVKQGSGKRESVLNGYIWQWALEQESGEVYSPSTGILLPDGAIKSPDCAWVSDERLATSDNTGEEEDYLEVIPNFVAELRSVTDRLPVLQQKMEEVWMANGVQLGWLIDPYEETAWIYREQQSTEKIQGFEGQSLKGDPLMPGLVLPLDKFRVSK